MSAPALDDDLDDAPSSAPRFAGWPRPFQNLATCASPLRDADGRATTHRLAVSPGGVDDGEPRAREGSGPRRAGAAGRATDDADATRADIAPWFGAGGGSALPCGRVLLAHRRSLRTKNATDPNTGRSLSNDSEKSAKSAGHPRRRLPLDPDLRAPPLIDAPARRDQSPHCERHSTLASYETNPASNVRLLTRPALGTSSRDPASAVPSRPAPAAPFRRTPDRRRLHLFPQVIRLKRDTERSK